MELDTRTIILIAAAITIIGVGSIYYYSTLNKPAHTVTVQIIGNGRVSLGSAGAYTTLIQVNDGENIMLTAQPDPGWTFSQWSGDLSGTSNPINVVVTKNLNIVGIFIKS